MLLRKYLLVMESQVSKCGFHLVKKRGDVLYLKRTKYSKYRKGRCSRGCKPDGTQLGFGRYGTKSCRAGPRNEKEDGTLELYYLSAYCLPKILLLQLVGHRVIQISRVFRGRISFYELFILNIQFK